MFQGCQQWFCNPSKTCELNALSNCGTTKGGNCNAGVMFTQTDDPPVDKRFLPPDNVNFREVATLAFTVYNNTASALRLDKIPLTLETMGAAASSTSRRPRSTTTSAAPSSASATCTSTSPPIRSRSRPTACSARPPAARPRRSRPASRSASSSPSPSPRRRPSSPAAPTASNW
ncbi:hypothetical protein [Nannocystis pusilla]|uniref:hypothetical protein n=1 Tax=Nannocystis pusilla TaxID=889268 RepID=UPI003B80C673